MEGIEEEITNKLIEKPIFETDNLVKVKEKKPRTQAQKDAFEKARAKRAENLAKKKELENEKVKGEIETTETTNPISKELEKPKPKPKGRPKGSRNKKVMRDLEPPPTPDNPNYPQPVFHSPHQAQDHGLKFQGHNPYHYQQPPQVHNYYYGHQQGITTKRTKTKKERPPTPPPPSSESEEEISSSSSEEEIYEEPVPELKYRFA